VPADDSSLDLEIQAFQETIAKTYKETNVDEDKKEKLKKGKFYLFSVYY
jgi:hypothetical protein